MKRYSGFSLIELMVVITIIGILAAIAVPQYTEYVRRSALVDASSTLADLRVRMEQAYQDNRTYVGTIGGNFTNCNIQPPNPNPSRFFTYTCAAGTGAAIDTYLLTATGLAGSKGAGFTYTIDQNNLRQTTAVPSGFTSMTISSGSPANCFIMNKGATSC